MIHSRIDFKSTDDQGEVAGLTSAELERATHNIFSGRLTDKEWKSVARAVRGLQLDADRTTVSGTQCYIQMPHCDADPPSGFALPPYAMMLRAAIQRILFENRKPIAIPVHSPEKHARIKRHVEKLHQQLLDSNGPDWDWTKDEDFGDMLLLLDYSRTISGASRRRLNRYNPQRTHLFCELLELWIELGGKQTGHAAENFLHACVVPVLGETRDTTSKAIARWLERRARGEVFFNYSLLFPRNT